MKVFVTGATGYIGSAVVQELLKAGHQVLGLTRSDAGATQLEAVGAQVHRGTLEDLESLRTGAAAADGVIHLAFVHSFPGVFLAPGKDKTAIDAIGSVLQGTNKPLVVTGAILGVHRGHVLTEDFVPDYRRIPRKSEPAVMAWAKRGVRASVVRLSPSVHSDEDKKGFVAWLVTRARKNKAAVFIKDGRQRWTGVHRLDAARLFRLALENGVAGGIYHGVENQGVAFGDIAAAIGQGLGLPAVSKSSLGALRSLGILGALGAIDSPADYALTQQALGWNPTYPSLMEDLASGVYFLDTK